MENLHPIIEGWIEYRDERRRAALKSPSDWERDNPPAPLSEADRRRYRILTQFLRDLEGRGGKVSERETALARRMLAAGKPDAEFLRVLGRSKGKARLRMYRLALPTRGYDWLDLPKEKRVDVPARA
jgi:hypothetical protein